MKMWIVNDNVNHSDNDNGQWTHFDQKSSLDELKKYTGIFHWWLFWTKALDKKIKCYMNYDLIIHILSPLTKIFNPLLIHHSGKGTDKRKV